MSVKCFHRLRHAIRDVLAGGKAKRKASFSPPSLHSHKLFINIMFYSVFCRFPACASPPPTARSIFFGGIRQWGGNSTGGRVAAMAN